MCVHMHTCTTNCIIGCMFVRTCENAHYYKCLYVSLHLYRVESMYGCMPACMPCCLRVILHTCMHVDAIICVCMYFCIYLLLATNACMYVDLCYIPCACICRKHGMQLCTCFILFMARCMTVVYSKILSLQLRKFINIKLSFFMYFSITLEYTPSSGVHKS